MAIKESNEAALLRWDKLELVQSYYSSFAPFLGDVMNLLGFESSPLQHDIGSFLAYGPLYSMVQAQRGQAKTTISAAFAVWTLIHNPHHRVLVLSAGGTQANEISTLIVRIIMSMDELECMRPDKANGDRTSVEAFDVHYTLKGIDKSPSVACVGITGNLQGKRADLLIADDIESMKNSMTATMREQLMNLTRDFTSINSTGRILYLGTPQSMESIYNTLPARGFTVRIWPGRYPTPEQIDNYGDMLAPSIRSKLERDYSLCTGGGMLGDQGQPTDPTYLTEEVLQKKELDQGPSYFQLQHMLNTKLADAARFPLKIDQLVMMKFNGPEGNYPLTITRGFGGNTLKDINVNSVSYKINTPHEISQDTAPLQGRVMYIDPAGGGKNGDETAYAVTGFLNGNIYVMSVGGIPGGYGIAQMEKLAEVAEENKVQRIIIEKNMGYGAFAAVFLPILRKVYECAVDEDYVTGQKELRIVETLEPVIARGSLIFSDEIHIDDAIGLDRYEAGKRTLYTLFHQLSKMSRERGALVHDDRADALEGAVRYWVKLLGIDQEAAVERLRAAQHQRNIADPMMRNRHAAPSARGNSVMSRFNRRR